ncbi:MAG: hypothetical protein ACI4PG_04100 [Candidatus Ventricola sp.]
MKKLLSVILCLTCLMMAAAAQAQLLAPMEPGELSTADADYCVRITEADHINAGGYFAMEMYEQDQYPSDAVQALAAGDVIVVNGALLQVDSVIEYEEGMLEIRTIEGYDGYIALIPSGENYCALVNDWIPCTYVGTVKVWLPLPDAFVYLSVEADDQLHCTASEFIRMLEADGGAQMNPYNTIASFRDGLLVQVMHASYPFGPEE